MAIAQRKRVAELAVSCCEQAKHVCDVIWMSEGVRYSRKGMSLATLPVSQRLELGWGFQAWAVILSVDMVGSSARAERLGHRATYITMHTYMPVMAWLAARLGRVVGLRGDGLFAAFGLKEVEGEYQTMTEGEVGEAVGNAARTGQAMIEGCEVINEVLSANKVEGGVRVRVGIDYGKIVVTRIGLEDAQEITTYGGAVNEACKMRNNGRVTVAHRANQFWKSQASGTIRRKRYGANWILSFDGQRMLS